MWNEGNARFSPPSVFLTGDSGGARVVVKTADLDADGDLDLLKVNGNDLSALWNEGNGSFIGPTSIREGALSADVGDLDSDGDTDLAVSESGPVVSVLLNNGDGTFILGEKFEGQGARVLIGDLDSDGDLDLASTPAVLLNNGDGTFVPRDGAFADCVVAEWQEPGSFEPSLLGDLDADGDLDAVAFRGAGFGPGWLRVCFNQGDATFSGGIDLGAQDAHTADVVDLDSDGDLDIVAANGYSGPSVWLNDGQGGFETSSDFPAGLEHSGALTAGDFDGDGAATSSPGTAGRPSCPSCSTPRVRRRARIATGIAFPTNARVDSAAVTATTTALSISRTRSSASALCFLVTVTPVATTRAIRTTMVQSTSLTRSQPWEYSSSGME